MPRVIMVLCAVLCAVLSLAVWRGDLRADSRDRDAAAADTFVITASRGSPQLPLDIPQSVAVVTRPELDSVEYHDLHQAIQGQPGVGLAPAEGTPSYWQQGFTVRGLGGQRVLLLSDGVRQSGQGIGYGGGNLSLYDTFGIERIEILKGPSSVLYGTDAFGGVINVIYREPLRREEWGVNGSARYAYDGAYRLQRSGAFLDFGDENYAALLGGSYVHAGEPRLPDDLDPQSGSYRSTNFWGKADFFLSERSRLRLLANSNYSSDISIWDSQIELPLATFPPPGSQVEIAAPLRFFIPLYRRSLLGLEYTERDLSQSWAALSSGVYWQQVAREFNRSTAYYPNFTPGFAGPPLFFDPESRVSSAVVDTDDSTNTYEWHSQSKHLVGAHLLTAGLDVGYDSTRQRESETRTILGQAGMGPVAAGVPESRQRLRADAEQLRVGFYLQDVFDAGAVQVMPGLRLDSFSVSDDISDFSETEWGVSGSLGLVYDPYSARSYYLNLASGFRVPDLAERFLDGIVNLGVPSRVKGNPDLDPERAYSAELGTKYDRGPLRYQTAGFYTRVRDYISTVGLGPQAGFLTDEYQNVGTVDLYGWELAVDWAFSGGWELYGNVSRTGTDSSELVAVPGWLFNYGLSYGRDLDHCRIASWRSGLDLRSAGSWTDNTEGFGRSFFSGADESGFTVVDWRLNLALRESALGRVNLTLALKNIFDELYYEPFFALPQPGRSFLAALAVDF